MPSTDDRTPITRRTALSASLTTLLAAGAASMLPTPAVAAQTTLAPADEACMLLERVESLLTHDLRWDDEARSSFTHVSQRLYDITTAYDPQRLTRVDPITPITTGSRWPLFRRTSLLASGM